MAWRDDMALGIDELDSCHHRMVECLDGIRQALARRENFRAERLLEELRALSRLHDTAEEAAFHGQPQEFPQEIIEFGVHRLRSAVRDRFATDELLNLTASLENLLASEIACDRRTQPMP